MNTCMRLNELIFKHKFVLLLLVPLALYFAFGFYHLTKFETADEHFWIYQDRLHNYWQAMGDRNWKGTRINDKPGITLAYISGTGLLSEGDGQQQRVQDVDGLFQKHDPAQTERINFLFRAPLLALNGLFAFYFFWILGKLTGSKWTALMACSLILLSPVLLGISQIVNPDSLSWVLVASTLLTFLVQLKHPAWKFVWLTGLFFGLALATKYIAAILIPFFLLIILAWLVFGESGKLQFKDVRRLAQNYYLIVAGGLFVFSLLMPAVFVKKVYLTKDLLGSKGMQYIFWPMMTLNLLVWLDAKFLQSRILNWLVEKTKWLKKVIFLGVPAILLLMFLFVLINWVLKLNWWNLDEVPFDSRQSDLFGSLSFLKQFVLQSRPLVFSLTPVVLLSLLGTWAWSLGKWGQKDSNNFTVIALSLFFLAYYVAVSWQGLLVTIRYGIILYPLAAVMAAIGIQAILRLWSDQEKTQIIVFLGLVTISAFSLWQVRPFYFNYSSSFLPKNYVITNAWGYGGYEAAQFINHQTGLSGVKVISDYAGVCSFVTAPCLEMSNDVRGKIIKRLAEQDEEFYFVLTRRGQARWNYVGEFNQFNGKEPLWERVIDERSDNFVRVYRGR
ncbi:phospholipid carrier-dependent glycosyltransferase [Patescibacteria group bacterium]|nr:MAG: phospholipid carrier-dependent glycosyltransferase [Patescibacteria group bacterium]